MRERDSDLTSSDLTSSDLTGGEPAGSDDVHGALVAGYDGSEHARRALEWAAEEAALRGAVLAPAVVIPPMMSLDLPDAPSEAALRTAAQLLDDAARLVRERAPGVEIAPVQLVDSPAGGLVRLAETAQLVVVGSRGRGGVASMVLGSVSLRVAQRAACPVVVVPAGSDPGNGSGIGAGTGSGTARRIVVGVDGSAPSEAALSFAVSEARLRGADLVAVYSVADPYLGSGFVPPAPELVRARDEAGTRFLREDLETWRAKHPEIAIVDVLSHEPPGAVLPERAAGAAMLVVGARGRGSFAGMLLGSVSHAVLHAATVPVAVVRAEAPAT